MNTIKLEYHQEIAGKIQKKDYLCSQFLFKH